MLNCNYYIAIGHNLKYTAFGESLQKQYKSLHFFYEKESLIKSIEFLSQNQAYLDNNIFVVFTDAEFEYEISKYLRKNLDASNYVLISYGIRNENSINTDDILSLSDADILANKIINILSKIEEEVQRKSNNLYQKLQTREFYEIGKLLSSERDIYKLFDMIISASQKITFADAVTLYLVEDQITGEWSSIEASDFGSKVMRFVISKNMSTNTDYQAFTIPITKHSITGYTAINGKSLRIDNTYAISPDNEYNHDSSFDSLTGYKTISMLSVPMKDRNNNITGVIQLINKKIDNSIVNYNDTNEIKKIIPFNSHDELTMNSIAGQAAVALENNILYRNINQLLENYASQNEKLSQLSRKILKAHEEERKRIAREIHDGPAQSAACLALKLELCKKQLQNHAYSDLAAELEKLGHDVRSTVQEIRTVIYDLKPSYLDDGLFAALQNHIDVCTENNEFELEYRTYGSDKTIEYYIVSTVFRIVQEALTNISKHAEASKVNITISITDNKLELLISDNGKGFDTDKLKYIKHEQISGGFGIEGMLERVELIKGVIDINSAYGKGTSIRIYVPLK